MAEFMGTKAAAELWGVSQDAVRRWCNDPKLRAAMGAEQDAKYSPWRIPIDAQCPRKPKK